MQRRFRWWHGLVFYAGVQAVSYLLKVSVSRRQTTEEEDRELYRQERLPIFAPPPIAFPIAWSINSFSSITGGLHVLNLPAGSPGRTDFLRSQASAWLFYVCFQAAYFGLRSPINAEIVTLLYTAATAASFRAAQKMHDTRAAVSLAPTAAWLLLANPVGLTQALWNHDSFWNVGPFVDPPAGWVKS